MLQDVIQRWGGREVPPMEVYRDIFNLGENDIQRKNEALGSFKANPVAYWKNANEKKGHYRIMFDDTFEETLEELQKADFSILNCITYFGRKNLQEHASKMYAMIFDIDGVTDKTLNAFLSGAIVADVYPVPNYVVLSGHGVHLYYVFEYPIPLYPNIKLQLKELKYALTEKMWNVYTSTEEKKQFQGINQGFRVIGGKTKEGAPETMVRAFCLNTHSCCLEQLNRYVEKKHWIDESKLFKESKLTLSQAQKKYPKWYEKVILNKDKMPKKWDISGKVNGDNPYALYDWWIRQIKAGATFRHRYFNIMCLAIYAIKCDVSFERLEKDAAELIPFLNSINPEEPFTREDVDCALECYDQRYYTFPIKDIEKLSGIPIERNDRKGRKQDLHLKLARANRDILCEERGKKDWREGNGRKSAEQKIREYLENHPDARKCDIITDLGLTKPTVYKWWKVIKEGQQLPEKVPVPEKKEVNFDEFCDSAEKNKNIKEILSEFNQAEIELLRKFLAENPETGC